MITTEMREMMRDQIGMGNLLSISGGRIIATDNGIDLPVSNGYRVRVTYQPHLDLYSVERVLKRGDKEFIKGRAERVFCSELGQMAYRAGMFRSFDENEWPQ